MDYADCAIVSQKNWLIITLMFLSGWFRWQVDVVLGWFFESFLVKKHGINYTLWLSWLGLKLDPLLTFRCSVAQSQQGAAISEPHESCRGTYQLNYFWCKYFLQVSSNSKYLVPFIVKFDTYSCYVFPSWIKVMLHSITFNWLMWHTGYCFLVKYRLKIIIDNVYCS